MRDANAQIWDANATAAELLAKCQARDIALQANAGHLDIDAPAGELLPELLQALRTRKAELLELLAGDPQDLQAHGDAAGPVTAGSDPQDSGADFPPVIMGPTFDRTEREPLQVRGVDTHFLAHGWQDGSQDPAAAPQATAGPRPRAAVPVAIEWPAAAADFALLLAPDDLPPAPFNLNPWTAVQDAAKFLRWLRADIRRGPSGPRAFYGALQSDLLALQRFALQAADDRQRRETRKAGEA